MTAHQVAAAAAETARRFGGALDLLVVNAGRCETIAERVDVDDIWATWEVNVRGAYACKECGDALDAKFAAFSETLAREIERRIGEVRPGQAAACRCAWADTRAGAAAGRPVRA